MSSDSLAWLPADSFSALENDELRLFDPRSTSEPHSDEKMLPNLRDAKKDSKSSTRHISFGRRVKRFGWWWEVGSILLSITSVTLIFAILIKMDQKPLTSWRLPIQINSLIAIFSTLSRSALLLGLAGGLSQLKWNHFEKRSRTLDQLQIFDDASRGPWGSFVFFYKMRGAFNALAAIGAFMTVISLAFEPFTQQILDFPSRRGVLVNETVSLSRAESFGLLGHRLGGEPHAKSKILQTMIALLPDRNSAINSHYFCPAGDCEIPDHWSLTTRERCDPEEIWDDEYMQCNYTLPWSNKEEREARNDLNFTNLQDFKDGVRSNSNSNYKYINSHANCDNVRGKQPDDRSWRFYTYPPGQRRFWVNYNYFGEDDLPLIEKCEDMEFCPRLFSVGGLVATSDFPPIEELDEWDGVRISRLNCRVELVSGHTSKSTIRRTEIQKTEELFPLRIDTNPKCNISAAACREYIIARPLQEDSGPSYSMDSSVRPEYLYTMFAELANDILQMSLTMEYFKNSTASDVAKMLSSTVNVFLRSNENSKATNLTGTAFGMQTYVKVRWEWAILPVIIVAASVSFLICTILESRNKHQLYKSSALPGYLHYMDEAIGDGLDDSSVLSAKDDFHMLVRKGRMVRGRLRRDGRGNLRLVKDDGK